jgi:flagellar protein FliS
MLFFARKARRLSIEQTDKEPISMAANTSGDLKEKVLSATPHELVLMLYEGALGAIRAAKESAAAGDAEGSAEQVGTAVGIIANGLKANLDMKAGELSERLSGLYDYVVSILLRANLKKDPALLAEAEGLVSGLAEAWRKIAPEAGKAAAA